MIRRSGFALVYALFMVLAISVVGLGLMATGTTEASIAAAVLAHAQARTRAEAAALQGIATWSTAAFDSMDLGATLPYPPQTQPGDHEVTVTVTRLDSGLYLLHAHARSPRATARAGLLVRAVSPSAAAALFPGALVAGDAVEVRAGSVSGVDACEAPGIAIQAPRVTVGPAASVHGQPPVQIDVAPAGPAPDPFAPAIAARLATATPRPGTIAPRPVASPDGCAPDDRNWGALDPAHPCHDLRPLVHVAGSLRMAGGVGHGILVVNGDAHLTAGARFRGVLVVHGHLHVDQESSIDGSVRAGSAFIDGGHVRRDRCATARVLSEGPLSRPFRPPDRWWVAQF